MVHSSSAKQPKKETILKLPFDKGVKYNPFLFAETVIDGKGTFV